MIEIVGTSVVKPTRGKMASKWRSYVVRKTFQCPHHTFFPLALSIMEVSVSIVDGSCPNHQHPTEWSWCSCIPWCASNPKKSPRKMHCEEHGQLPTQIWKPKSERETSALTSCWMDLHQTSMEMGLKADAKAKVYETDEASFFGAPWM